MTLDPIYAWMYAIFVAAVIGAVVTHRQYSAAKSAVEAATHVAEPLTVAEGEGGADTKSPDLGTARGAVARFKTRELVFIGEPGELSVFEVGQRVDDHYYSADRVARIIKKDLSNSAVTEEEINIWRDGVIRRIRESDAQTALLLEAARLQIDQRLNVVASQIAARTASPTRASEPTKAGKRPPVSSAKQKPSPRGAPPTRQP